MEFLEVQLFEFSEQFKKEAPDVYRNTEFYSLQAVISARLRVNFQ